MDVACEPRDNMTLTIDATTYPDLRHLLDVQLRIWPEHEKFLAARFSDNQFAFANRIAGLVRLAASDLDVFAADYRWLCERMGEEELFFRREGRYRLSTFAEANREV